MTDAPEGVVITQADRNSAVRLLEAGGQDWQAKEIRLAQGDRFPTVQAFARHRTEATHPLPAEIADLRQCTASLWDAIKHGDDEHRVWLKEAIDAHFAGEVIPEPRGKGRKEAEIADLRDQLDEAM